MEFLTIQLDGDLDPQLVPELEKQSVYVCRGLRQFRVSPDRNQVLVSFEDEDEDKDEVRARMTRFIDAMRRGFRPVEMKVIARNERHNQQPYETDVFRKLVGKRGSSVRRVGRIADPRPCA